MNQFFKDLKREKESTQKVIKYYTQRGYTLLENRDDNKYDLKISKNNKIYTLELKEHFLASKTNNVAIEFSCRGKDSGIKVSEADYYLNIIHTKTGIYYNIIKSSVLKQAIEDKLYHKIVNGGDKGSNSLCYLFRKDIFTKLGKNFNYDK